MCTLDVLAMGNLLRFTKDVGKDYIWTDPFRNRYEYHSSCYINPEKFPFAVIPSLKLTAKALKSGWFGRRSFPCGYRPIFRWFVSDRPSSCCMIPSKTQPGWLRTLAEVNGGIPWFFGVSACCGEFQLCSWDY